MMTACCVQQNTGMVLPPFVFTIVRMWAWAHMDMSWLASAEVGEQCGIPLNSSACFAFGAFAALRPPCGWQSRCVSNVEARVSRDARFC